MSMMAARFEAEQNDTATRREEALMCRAVVATARTLANAASKVLERVALHGTMHDVLREDEAALCLHLLAPVDTRLTTTRAKAIEALDARVQRFDHLLAAQGSAARAHAPDEE